MVTFRLKTTVNISFNNNLLTLILLIIVIGNEDLQLFVYKFTKHE